MAVKADKWELLVRVETAVGLAGWQVLWLNSDHPAKVRFFKNEGGSPTIDAWLHIWNLTPGGRSWSMPSERRIQPTGIQGQFSASPNARTIILGWSAEFEVFAAFDYSYHSATFGTSSSIQTDTSALEEAATKGLGVYEKGTGELSVAIRPDMLGLYVELMQVMHASGRDPHQLDVFRKMASNPLDVEPSELPKARRKVMSKVLRLLRDRRFGQQVLDAYLHQCALCGVQLRLLDAAHILPVAHPESDDKVTNGVALCSLHHRAYDAALVTFDVGHKILISQPAVNQLTAQGRIGGLKEFASALRPSLVLPQAKSDYPSPPMILKANELRGW